MRIEHEHNNNSAAEAAGASGTSEASGAPVAPDSAALTAAQMSASESSAPMVNAASVANAASANADVAPAQSQAPTPTPSQAPAPIPTPASAAQPIAAQPNAAAPSQTPLVPAGTVVLAATPIGNVADASPRLAALIEGADIIAAEDTRRLYDLANRLNVRVGGRVVAYHDHNERDKADGLLDEVAVGASVLVVSDAGMPTINDPGLAIVRRAIERGLPVTCAPGPSAVLDALALSGLPTDRFCYEGFLPRKHSERTQHLRSLRSERRTMVFYETPHRIADAMEDLRDAFGPGRPMALARELTKVFEEVRRGTIGEILDSVAADPPRGEIVLVIQGASDEEALSATPAQLSVQELAVLAADRALEDGLRIKDAITQVVQEHPLPDGSLPNRKQVYAAVLDMKR